MEKQQKRVVFDNVSTNKVYEKEAYNWGVVIAGENEKEIVGEEEGKRVERD